MYSSSIESQIALCTIARSEGGFVAAIWAAGTCLLVTCHICKGYGHAGHAGHEGHDIEGLVVCVYVCVCVCARAGVQWCLCGCTCDAHCLLCVSDLQHDCCRSTCLPDTYQVCECRPNG